MAEGENQTGGGEPGDSPSGGTPAGIIPKTPGKRGRPAGSKNSPKILDTGSNQENRASVGATPDALESAKFIGVGVVALIELGESFVHSSCAGKIEKRMPGKLDEFRQMAKALGLQEKDKELISDCSTKIALKHELLTKYAPEVVLAVTLAQYSMRQITLLKFVENVTKVKPAAPAVKEGEAQPQGQ